MALTGFETQQTLVGQWMTIDEAALLYGLDHINTVCNEIDAL